VRSGDPKTELAPPPYVVPHSQEPIRILYRDRDLLVVEKPHLLLSVPGRHPINHDSLILRLRRRFPGVEAVHRLDLDTSGIMVVPLHRQSLAAMGRLFQQRAVDKTYQAIVWGQLDADTGSVDLPIARDWENRPKQKICLEQGKPSLTHFSVLSRQNRTTVLELKPVTGRSHQLRIHMREIGHPILGCDMYAHEAAFSAAPRLLLHASRLAFDHPLTGLPLCFRSQAPFINSTIKH
jgi:tRNA pseudouridine32 synthase/23S rRNA pseudouridine746 synthase